ncbi:MAG: nuclear transport factor 2 family protein, partial [Solirubrobacteraceae bacterium]
MRPSWSARASRSWAGRRDAAGAPAAHRAGYADPIAHPNDELIQRFYAAFARRDGDAMAECYAPAVHFSDPVFVDLRDREPGAMWRMLTGRSRDLVVTLQEHEADEAQWRARWLADY